MSLSHTSHHKTKEQEGWCDILVSTEYYVLQELLKLERRGERGDLREFFFLILDEVHELTDNMMQILAVLRLMPVEYKNLGILIMSAAGPGVLISKYLGVGQPLILEAKMLAPVEEIVCADIAQMLPAGVEA